MDELDEYRLPPDIQDELDRLEQNEHTPPDEQTLTVLENIGKALFTKLQEDIEYRKNSGIEEVWRKCEEAYLGIDDANRYEFVNAKWAKPIDPNAPVVTGEVRLRPDEEVRSTVFVRLTARYVDAATAKVTEILFPPDDKPFSIKPTPEPDVVKFEDDHRQVQMGGQLLTRHATPDEQQQMQPPLSPGGTASQAGQQQGGIPPNAQANAQSQPVSQPAPPPLPPGKPLLLSDLAKEQMEAAQDSADKAEKRIWNWMVEANFTSVGRKLIADAARLGVGILKAPTPMRKQAVAVTKGPDGRPEVRIEQKTIPGCRHIDPWNFFPAKGCGESINHGDHVWERDFMTTRQIRDLKGQEGYIASQIDRVITEGPSKKYLTDEKPYTETEKEDQYEVFHFVGVLTHEEMQQVNPLYEKQMTEEEKQQRKAKDLVFGQVSLVNDTVIKGTLNPMTGSGAFGYHTFPWQDRAGSWAGIGVSEQVVVPQRIVNAATRAMLNNAGKSGGSQVVVDRGSVEPVDKKWAIQGGDKLWYKAPECDDVRKAFAMFTIPNQTPHYMSIIEYGFRLAEESTSIPLITQGAQGKTTPDTYGAAKLQDSNANQLLRSIGYRFDDYVTEPAVRGYYEWLLLDPDVPDEEKAVFVIDAHGSIALVERYIQDQTIEAVGKLVTNPAFGIDPKKWFAEWMQTKRLDARKVQYTEAEQKKISQQPPPKAPQVEAAQIRAQADLQQTQMAEQNESQQIQAEHDVRMKELDIKLQIAMLDYSNRRGIALDAVKAELAGTAMRLRVQKELSAQDAIIDLHKHKTPHAPQVTTPPTEPAGRAEPGHAFEQ